MVELKTKNLSKSKKQQARILIAQPLWNSSQIKRDAQELFRLEFTKEDGEFLNAVLAKAEDEKVDLVVFPEFSIPEQHHGTIGNWTSRNEVIVVAGSTYLEHDDEFYNTASVFFKGIQHTTEKQNLSPHERSRVIDSGPSDGTYQTYFQNTPVGNLAIIICADEFYSSLREQFLNEDLDILCVIACQPKAKEHHQSIDRVVKEYKKGIYVAYCNALCDSLSDGRSAFFANDYDDGFKQFKQLKLTRDDGIDKRIIEMPSVAGCLIVQCNLQDKLVTFPNIDSNRALVEVRRPFVFEDGHLRQLALDEIKASTKPSKEKTEYQPSIPPVKTFVADYIGRKADIDYLNEFLNNFKKHFLLMYGVGGMGKSHLLHLCMNNYHGKSFFYHLVSPNENFFLNKLFEICLIPKPDDKLSLEERQSLFLKIFQENNVHLIIDDYYEIQDEEVKTLLPKLIGIGKGKLLILSRVIPSEVIRLTNDFLKLKIPPLLEPEFKQVIQNYIKTKNINLSDDEIHLIFEKAQGYPLGGQLIIDAKPYSTTLNELLNELPKFEAELDPDGKYYSGRLLDKIFEKGNDEEISLLCEFSALFGPSDIETVRQLPSYELRVFEGLHERKSFVDVDTQGKFSSHALIKDFAYYRLKNKQALHLKLGIYFESRINGRTDDDWKWLNEAILHYTRADKDALSSFKLRVERQFESRNVKGLIEKSRINTIRNYATLINLYPDKPAYYNELGIAYRRNSQKNAAIETFLSALKIEPKHLPSLNELGITYRENNQKAKAIETFLSALKIEPDNIKVLNELGITYRENNQKAKAIDTFLSALKIEPDNIKVLNELGITYRENNQIDDAVASCLKAIKVSRHKQPYLNLLQIYLFFKPDKQRAKENYDVLMERPIPSHFNHNRRRYLSIINSLDSIWNLSDIDVKLIDEFIYWAIMYHSYSAILPLLQKLDEKLPDNSRIKSKLGKTLCNQVVGRQEEGWGYLKQAIQLFKKENNIKQFQHHVIHYYYGLMYHQRMKLLDEELKAHADDLICDADYFIFMAHYIFSKKQNLDEAIAYFEKAINIAEGETKKREYAESLLRFLSGQDSTLYKEYFLKFEALL